MTGLEVQEIHIKKKSITTVDYKALGRIDKIKSLNFVTTFKSSREKDSRTRPANLIGAQTSMPRQRTVVETALVKFTENDNEIRRTVSNPNPAAFIPPEIATHWEVALRNKIKDRSQNLAQDMAEYRQTCSLYQQLAFGLKDLRSTVKGRRFNTISGERKTRLKRRKVQREDFACNLSGKVLATNFGILPLVGSLGSAFETLVLATEQSQLRRFVVTKTKEERVKSAGWTGSFRRSDRATFYVTFDLNKSDFSLGNPLELAYELTPYSFVLDWMFPVGSYLKSLDALSGVLSAPGSVSTKLQGRLNYHNSSSPTPVSAPYTLETAPTLSYDSTERNAYSTVPQGSLSSIVEYTPSSSFHAVVNGIALLTGLSDSCGNPSR